MNHHNIKHIIWDWNGTLINDAWLFVELMNEELSARNLKLITIEDYRLCFTFPVKKYYECLGFDFEKEDFKTVGYQFIQKFKKRKFEAQLFPESIQILQTVNHHKITQSIVSAQENALLNETVKYYQIDQYFNEILGIEHYYADDKIKVAKLHREKLPYKNNSILMIGDSAHDFEVAQSLGIQCILCANGHYAKQRLMQYDCLIVDSHTELVSKIVG
tara:strand:+ start:2974 stop:3624 length:651 start_codon:yes stop_codon:yes gene_type:complete